MAGFAEQSKTSVVHMCSLFHAFILCQLWTVYLEQTIALLPAKDEQQVLASSILLDFWGKVINDESMKNERSLQYCCVCNIFFPAPLATCSMDTAGKNSKLKRIDN